MGEILINQLFAGAYLQEASNIGHEVINLFRDDNDENFLYITPYGNVSGHNVDSVLFVQNIKARETMEVVMKAEGLSGVSAETIREIYYAGVNITDIFSKNMYHGGADLIGLDIMATFRAEDVRFPKKSRRIIITVDENYVSEDDNTTVIMLDPGKSRIVGQGMRTYLSADSYPSVFETINDLLLDESLWEDSNTTQKLFPDGSFSRAPISFLEIIRKENDELVMSNLLAYYFNYHHEMFSHFATEVLGIESFGSSFEIIRESMNNIDLLIRDEEHVIVIENKLKSHLNGKTDDGKNQLNKYYEYTERYIKENGIASASYYLFVPNYNDLTVDDANIKGKYKVIFYSEIYDFFKRNAAEYLTDRYFADFLNGLKNHTMTDSELRFSIMRSRFLEKINQR